MIKSACVMGCCLALLVLSSALQVEGSKTFSLQENSNALSLPQVKGAWLIEMSRDGGMRPRKQSVQINSNGEIRVTSEHYSQGRTTVDCSLKAKLSAEDLLKLKESVRAAKLSAWRERYEDPKHPICCDQPTTRLTLHRRGGRGVKTIYQTSWYPGSSQMRPADLVSIATLGQMLWNKTSERCTEQSAGD